MQESARLGFHLGKVVATRLHPGTVEVAADG
jgi:hypothetical protein